MKTAFLSCACVYHITLATIKQRGVRRTFESAELLIAQELGFEGGDLEITDLKFIPTYSNAQRVRVFLGLLAGHCCMYASTSSS